MLLPDKVTGPAIAALGAAAALAGSRLPPVPGQQVGPSAFPVVIGLGLVACGILIAAGIGRSFEDGEEAADTPAPFPAWRAAVPPALLVLYALAADTLGFVPTAFLIVAILARLFGAGWRLTLGVAALAPPLIHLAFYKLLRVPLPDGLLAMPWS